MIKLDFSRKKIIYVNITILFLIFIVIMKFEYNYLGNKSYDSQIFWMKVFGGIGWLAFIWSLLTWKSLRGELICLYTFYLVAFYFFTFGQSLLIVFNLVSDSRNLLNRVTTNQLIEAQIFSLLCLVAFHVGALMVCKKPPLEPPKIIKNSSNKIIDQIRKQEIMLEAIKWIGILLLIFSLPGFIYDSVNAFKAVITEGYRALYGYDDIYTIRPSLISRIFSYTSSYFLPALICLFIAYKEKISVRTWVLLLMMIHIFNSFLIGGRGNATALILTIILLFHYCIKPIKGKKIILYGFLFYLLFSFFPIVADMRQLSNRTFMDYISVFTESFGKKNLFFEALTEIGGTMYPLVGVMMLVPDRYPFFAGKSYFFALTFIFPNLNFWDVHPAQKYVSGGPWLMEALNMSYGPGFTLIADAYRNFGWYGFLVLIGIGAFFGGLYSSVDTVTIHRRPDLICVMLIFFYSTLMSVRGDNLYIVRPLFYVVIPIYLLIHLINSYLKYLSKEKNMS